MDRHLPKLAVRTGVLAALAAVGVTAGLLAPASAAPSHAAAPWHDARAPAGPRLGPWVVVAARGGLAGTSGPVPATPDVVLTVKATNLAGQPDTGGVIQVFSVDSAPMAPQSQQFAGGVAKFSIPAGHYFALASFGGLASGSHAPVRTVILPQIDVTANTSVTVHETSADSKVTMVTPRPAAPIDTNIWFLRTRASGAFWSLEGIFPGSQQVWFSPMHATTTVGTLRMSVNQHLESPPGHGVPYEYTLSFTSPPGIIPIQRHVVSAKGLATIHERFYQPVTSAGAWAFNGSFPGKNANTDSWFGFIEPQGPGLHLPGRLTEYAGGQGSARMEWKGQYAPFPGLPSVVGEVRLLRAGEHLASNWGAYPLHPGVNALLTTLPNMFWMDGANIPSAVRAGNTLQLEVDPFDDNQPGHQIGLVTASGPAKAAGTYQIDQNGAKVAGGDAVAAAKFGLFYTTATLSAKPSTIRFSLNYTRTSTDFPLSTATSTVWTWHSAPVSGGQVPPGWSCVRYTYQPLGCAAQPMMTLGYAVARLRLDGTAPPGRQAIHLTVGHLQGATASAITAASVSVSFDGGTTWHKARLSGHGGSYTAVFTAPAGTMVTLRTSAADAADGSVTETITSAYQIGS